jgi:hypothetical protein
MIYKCDHCNYSTKRSCDLRRHQSKKRPCNKKIVVDVDKLKEAQNINADTQNINADTQNINADTQNINADTQNINADTQNINAEFKSNIYTCFKCQKQFNRKDKLKTHESVCDGVCDGNNVRYALKCLQLLKASTNTINMSNVHHKYHPSHYIIPSIT